MNKHSISILIAALAFGDAFAQEVIGSAGQTQATSNLIVSHTVGEMVTATLTNGTTLTQGFHQSDLVITSIDERIDDLLVTIHPNPFSEQVIINTDEVLTSIEVMDATGSLVHTMPVYTQSGQHSVQLMELPAGQYLLRIQAKGYDLPSTYRITKQ